VGPKVTDIDQGKPPEPGPKVANIWVPFTRTKPTPLGRVRWRGVREVYEAASIDPLVDGGTGRTIRDGGGTIPMSRSDRETEEGVRIMRTSSEPELLPTRWVVILLAAVVAALLIGGLTFVQAVSWPAALLAASAAAGMTVRGLHEVMGR
jgi:hypothetical protein